MSNTREILSFRMEETTNSYIVEVGKDGHIEKETTSRRIDALQILKTKIDREIKDESESLRRNLVNTPDSVGNWAEDGGK